MSSPQRRIARRLGYEDRSRFSTRTSSLGYLRQFIAAVGSNQDAYVKFVDLEETQRYTSGGVVHFRVRVADQRTNLRGLEESVARMFQNIYNYVVSIEHLTARDRMNMVIYTTGQRDTREVLLRSIALPAMIPVGEFNAQDIVEMVQRATTSDETFDLLNTRIVMKYVRAQVGGVPLLHDESVHQFIQRKRAIVQVGSSVRDPDCFWRCVLLGIADHECTETYTRWVKTIRRACLSEELAERLTQLRARCGGRVGYDVYIEDLQRYEPHLNYSLVVFNLRNLHLIYQGSTAHFGKVIVLGLVEGDGSPGHFYYIRKNRVGALFDKHYYCFQCMRPISRKRNHFCQGNECRACRRSDCEGRHHKDRSQFTRYCVKCNFHFYDQSCLDAHTCDFRRCSICDMIYPLPKTKKDTHRCFMYRCTNCHQHVSGKESHQCYMTRDRAARTPTGEPKLRNKGYIYYDIECFLGGVYHEPAMVIATYGAESSQPFDAYTFMMFRSIDMFMQWVLQKCHEGYVVIAHNGGRYDSHFIKRWAIQKGVESTDLVKGQRYIMMTFDKYRVKFIDSLQFLPFGLRKFPKAFGIEEHVKGYFPYRFYTREHANYRGALPEMEWFDFDHLNAKERAGAMQWYEEQKDQVFDMDELCRTYCESDVYLLAEGCTRFRTELLMSTGLDPYESPTIASAALRIYKERDMPEKSIGLFSPVFQEESSVTYELQQWLMKTVPSFLRWDGDMEEIYLGTSEREEGKHCYYLYANCEDHGCPKCTQKYKYHEYKFAPMYMLNARLRGHIEHLREQGHEVQCYTDCELYEDLSFQEFRNTLCDTAPISHTPFDLREGFFGGRTEPFYLYYKAQDHECIEYLDYTSLYPSIQSGKNRGVADLGEQVTYPYPVGHPVYIKSPPVSALFDYFGFARVHVTPPETLHIPVLPSRGDKKLVFDLNPKVGVWVIPELKKAVEKGYVIDEVYDIVHFPEKTETLFQPYVKRFFQYKTEAAGKGVFGDGEGWEQKLEAFEQYHDIQVDRECLGERNPSKYLVSKLFLNSLWGKFAQKQNRRNVCDVFSREDLCNYVFSDRYIVEDVHFHSEVAQTVVYTEKENAMKLSRSSNIAIAAFTTAYARLRLYEALDQYDARTLYCDTDSIICVRDKSTPRDVQVGEFLGDLTNELDEGDYIVEFVATAPKSYAYRTHSGKEVVHVKGFTLNYESSQIIDFDSMVAMVNDDRYTLHTPQLKFLIDHQHNIATVPGFTKTMKNTFTKRARQEPRGPTMNIGTLPKRTRTE